jgi:hypothetical protein
MEFDVVDLVNQILLRAAPGLDSPIDPVALANKVRDVLFGQRGLWQAYRHGIVTLDEASEAATAHLETWLTDAMTGSSLSESYRDETLALIRDALRRET